MQYIKEQEEHWTTVYGHNVTTQSLRHWLLCHATYCNLRHAVPYYYVIIFKCNCLDLEEKKRLGMHWVAKCNIRTNFGYGR